MGPQRHLWWVYFHCVGDDYVQDFADEVPGWDTTPGEGSWGGGWGTYDNAPMAGELAGVRMDADGMRHRLMRPDRRSCGP